MTTKKGKPHPTGYKLELDEAERARRAEQLKINTKPADNVLELLKTHTGDQVSQLTGLSKSTISRIKNGKHRSEIPV